jgi:hypothetical protein
MAKAAAPKDDGGTVLGEWMGKPIIGSTAKFTNLGDGLSKSHSIEGGIEEQGTLVTHVVRSKVGPHKLSLSEDEASYEVGHTFVGALVARIDDDLVAAALNAMELRIKQKEDEEAKQPTMPGVDEAAREAKDESASARLHSVENPADAEPYFDVEAPQPVSTG